MAERVTSTTRSNRFTVVIGPNGSGKSQLLRQLAIAAAPSSNQAQPTDEKLIGQQLNLPTRVLAVSNLVTDVFPHTSGGRTGYLYLGLRQATNSVSTGSLRDSTVNSIATCAIDAGRRGMLGSVLELLDLDGFRVTFQLRRTGKSSNIRPIDEPRRVTFGRKRPYREINEEEFFRQMDEFESSLSSPERRSGEEDPTDDVGGLAQLNQIARSFGIDLVDLIRYVRHHSGAVLRVIVQTARGWGPIDDLSAGQLMMLSSVARIAAHVEPGSLILIDEPETGLHPSWQSDVIPLLRATIPEEYGCHFFLATHSPHVVSDGSDVLVPGSSWGRFIEFEHPFFGRSVENLLYRVFAARVTGNTLVDNDLAMLLEFAAARYLGRSDLEQAFRALSRLEAIAGPDTVRLNELLRQVRHRIDELA